MDRLQTLGLAALMAVLLAPWTDVSTDGALALAWAALAWRLLGGPRGPCEALVGVALGLAIVASQPEGPRLRGPGQLVGVVLSSPTGREVDVQGTRWAPENGPWEPLTGRVRVMLPEPMMLAPGDGVVVQGTARLPWAEVPPGGPDGVANAARDRIRSVVYARSARRLGGDPRPIDPGVHPLLQALVTGDRRGLAPDVVDRFRSTGTSHLLAVSGSNVALAAALAAGLARALRGLLALGRPAGRSELPVLMLGAVGAAGFSIYVGLPVSVLRALLAALVVTLGQALGRRVVGASVLALAGLLIAAWDPAAVGSPSFQLSFGAVAGLLGWGKRLHDHGVKRLPRWLRPAGDALAISIAATLGTLPAAAWWFQAVPPLGPLANLVAVPWCGLFLMPAALTATVAPEPLAGWANLAGGWGSDVLVAVLALFEVEVWRPAVGPSGAALLCVAVLIPHRPGWAALLTTAVLAWPTSPPRVPTVTFPDVGQGAAAWVAWPSGEHWLVDGGPPWPGIAPWLRRQGVRHLDRVVLTHADLDHAGGLLEVLDTFSVGVLELSPSDEAACLLGVADKRGIQVLLRAASGPTANDASLLSVLRGGGDAVLPGDISDRVEAELAELIGPVRLLQLAHHGSRTSTGEPWLNALQPDLAVVQVGRTNRYGHPHPTVVDRLAERGVPLLRSDLHGTIEVRLTHPVQVRTWAPGGRAASFTPVVAPPTSDDAAP